MVKTHNFCAHKHGFGAPLNLTIHFNRP